MRFPSLNQIAEQTKSVIRNYPMELLAVVIGTYAATQATYHNTKVFEDYLVRILMTAALALPAFLAITLRGRYRNFSWSRRAMEYAGALGVLLLFFVTQKTPPSDKDFIRFSCLSVAAHLLVACAGFLGRGSKDAFWQFNRHLFLRIITAVIFSGVLFTGLAGAIAAMDALFSIHIDGGWYARLWIWIAGLFNTVFFLAGVPENATQLETEHDYPKVLKVFTQFVLMPLVGIYLCILLAYEAKIIVQWRLPNGWVSNLILAYGIVGILSILLMYPIRSMSGNKWIAQFSRWFYVLLLPLVALMFVAIGTRIGNYGFTEERVFVLALAIWLAGIAIFFLLRPNGDIRVIPATLALVAILVSVGPFSAFSISHQNQYARLGKALSKYGMLEGTKAVKPPHALTFSQRKNLSSTVQYLLEKHGNKSIEPYFKTDSLQDERWSGYENTQKVLKQVNVEYVSEYATRADEENNRWTSFDVGRNEPVNIQGYDLLLPLQQYGYDKTGVDSTAVHLVFKGNQAFALFKGKERLTQDVDPRNLFLSLTKKYGKGGNSVSVKRQDMEMIVQGKGCEMKVAFDRIGGSLNTKDDVSPMADLGGVVLVKWE